INSSTIGPKLNTGKNVNAPTITITLTSSVENNGVVTGNVPNDGGTIFLRARLPAIASIGMIIMKRPTSIAIPIDVLYQSVFAEIPAKAEPLLPVPEVNAYSISLSPCGPALFNGDVPNDGDTAEIAVNTRIVSGKTSTTSIAIFTSYDSIFLPRYSGVRPTISPAMNTESTMKMRMP